MMYLRCSESELVYSEPLTHKNVLSQAKFTTVCSNHINLNPFPKYSIFLKEGVDTLVKKESIPIGCVYRPLLWF